MRKKKRAGNSSSQFFRYCHPVWPYCEECFHEAGQPIHCYSYKPIPIFYGDGPMYMGVELEVDDGGKIPAMPARSSLCSIEIPLDAVPHTLPRKQIRRLTGSLARASEQRGTDASGIAYVQGQTLRIYKRPLPTHSMRWRPIRPQSWDTPA